MTTPATNMTVPIMDPNRGWRMWNIVEIYTGPSGTGRYVPNEDDLVVDLLQGFYRVRDVDYTTGLSVLIPWVLPKDPNAITDEDILLGVGPGYISEHYRIFLDTSVIPHTFACDSRLRIYGSQNSYIKIFKGTDIGVRGEVVSSFYDQAGNLLGENIPLELVAMPDHHNQAVKTPMVGYTSSRLDDGEVVTVVVYNDTGGVTSIARMLVKNTSFIRTTDASRRYITGIELISPFLSSADARVVEYPINVPIRSVPLKGRVNYSDGYKRDFPIDGTKFSLFGAENFVASIIGQTIPMVLTYKLSQEEHVYGASVGNTYHISEAYKATTVKADRSYTVKLYVFPVWVDAIVGYRLEYFMYNLERSAVYYVTPYVELGTNSMPFSPTEYGVTQEISVAIELDKVDTRFGKFRHVQTFGIALHSPGNEDRTCWSVRYSPGQDPVFGLDLQAEVEFVNVNNWRLRLDNGFGSLDEWLRHVYYNTQPLANPEVELVAPQPTHFMLVFANRRIELPISEWNKELTVPNDLKTGEVLYLEFIRRNVANDLQLGITGLRVQQKN